jgi:hypothetical protein
MCYEWVKKKCHCSASVMVGIAPSTVTTKEVMLLQHGRVMTEQLVSPCDVGQFSGIKFKGCLLRMSVQIEDTNSTSKRGTCYAG